MARIRTIKPEFWSDESISEISECAALLAIALLNFSDDEGYFNANLKLIKAFAFPIRETSRTVPLMIRELSEIGYLEFFKSPEGKVIGRVVNFKKHQVINKAKPTEFIDLQPVTFPFTDEYGSPKVALPSGKERKGREGNIKEKINKKENLPAKVFELNSELIAWGKKEQQAWTESEMRLHYEYFSDYMKNNSKRYKDPMAGFRNCVRGNWAKLRSKGYGGNKTYSELIAEKNQKAFDSFMEIAEGAEKNGIKNLI